MSKKDVFKYYKSGIEKISAKSNPFADAPEETNGTESDDAVTSAAHIKSNLWMMIAAALALCVAVGTFIIISKTVKIDHTYGSGQESKTVQTTDTSLPLTVSSLPDVSDSSKLVLTSSAADVSSAAPDKETMETVQQAIDNYSNAEDSIQEIFAEIKELSKGNDTDKNKINGFAGTLQSYYQIQKDSVNKILYFKHSLPEIIVLDTRFVEGSNPETIRATVLNLGASTAVISGVAKLKLSDTDYAYCIMAEQKSIEHHSCKHTAWYSSLNNESGINLKNKILDNEDSKKIDAAVQVTSDGTAKEINCEVTFKARNAMNEQDEKTVLEILGMDKEPGESQLSA